MEKILLADGTELEVQPGASLGETKIVVSDFEELGTAAEALIKEGNLATMQYKNDEQVTGIYPDMKLESPLFTEVDYYTDNKKVTATIRIREKTEVEKRLDAIEAKQSELDQSQQIQDGAILDLAGMVGGEV